MHSLRNEKVVKILLFAIVVLLGILLRFWQLSSVPPSLSHDEVAIGYNAYSILKTGKDEYGNSLPLLFRSFDDYKLPGMVYVTVPSIAVFGLNEFGVRFPSALFGSLSVIAFYFLVLELVGEKETVFLSKRKIDIVPIITFFFAVSLWHINFSRQSFESNGAVFFLLLGTIFLLKFPKKPHHLLFASVFYAISCYFYYSVRTMIPLLLLTALVVYRNEFWREKKYALTAFLLGVFLLLPLVPSLISKGGLSRISMVSVTNDSAYTTKRDNFSRIIALNPSPMKKIVYNRRIALGETVVENYFKNLSLVSIFMNGTGPAGLLYLIEAPFFFFGVYQLFLLKQRGKWILLAWFLSAPLAGAFSTDQPNHLRTLPNAVLLSLFSGIGFIGLLRLFRTQFQRMVFFSIVSVLFLFSFVRFLFLYFDYYPKLQALHFGDGYKQMVNVLQSVQDTYDTIYISGQYWRPYIFVIFWEKYDPKQYQKIGTPQKLEKYRFGNASWDKEDLWFGDPTFDFKRLKVQNAKKTLFILGKEEYELHKKRFIKISTIDGKYTKEVFVLAILKFDIYNRLTQL